MEKFGTIYKQIVNVKKHTSTEVCFFTACSIFPNRPIYDIIQLSNANPPHIPSKEVMQPMNILMLVLSCIMALVTTLVIILVIKEKKTVKDPYMPLLVLTLILALRMIFKLVRF